MENPFTIVTEFEIDLLLHTELQTIGGYKFFEPPSLGKFLVKKISATEFKTFSMICTHNSCIVALQANQSFICPCHGSAFSADGNVTNGPASLPLNTFRTEYFAMESKVIVFSY